MKWLLLLASLALAHSYVLQDNEVETARLNTSEDLLESVISDCFGGQAPLSCLKVKVLSYLDTQLGITSESARALDEKHVDKVIFDRVGRILNSNEFRFKLPEFLFQSAEVSYRADRGFDIDFPENDSENGEARGILKKKLLFPILLLLKLKMKALMPILLSIVGIKAIKALILSKLAVTLVLGFLVYNLLQKKGMPMMMSPTEAPPSPAPQYGPPAQQYGPPAQQYGPPSTSPPSPQDTYGSPQWEPAASSPYSRVWDPTQLAYNSYYPEGGVTSDQSPSSYTSVASVSSSVSSSSSSPN